jgi:uncharacterized membrane protein YccC
LAVALGRAMPALLYGLRLWASVCLALFVAFELELQNPGWAATSAAIVCQPSLGASLRKGGFRMIGTLIGATALVLMTAAFPQSRIGFLVTLALWIGACGFVAAILRNFAGYAAALSGYTAAIVFADASSDVSATFMLAVTRATEICLGIVCAGLVLAGTDFGTARRRLAAQIAQLVQETAAGLAGTLTAPALDYEALRVTRRALVLATARLDPVIDEAVGEASDLRARSLTLQRTVNGLLTALASWRNVANDRQVLTERGTPWPAVPDVPVPDMASLVRTPDAVRLRLLRAVRGIAGRQADTSTSRLIADRTADTLLGLCRALEGLVLLVQPDRARWHGKGHWPFVADFLPPLLIALRAALLIGVIEVFWVATAWQGGQFAVTFAAVAITLFSPQEAQAFALVVGFTEGAVLAVAVAAIVQFAVLPGLQGFVALSGVLAAVLIPAAALSAGTWRRPVFVALIVTFLPVLAPTNVAVYDPAAFFNSAVAIVIGIGAAAIAMLLLPPLPARVKIARLHGLTRRDLRRLAGRRVGWRRQAWEKRVFARVLALPDPATVLDGAQLLAAMSAGDELLRLRGIGARFGAAPALRTLEAAMAQGHIAEAANALEGLRRTVEAFGAPADASRLRVLAAAEVLSQIFARHGAYLAGAA